MFSADPAWRMEGQLGTPIGVERHSYLKRGTSQVSEVSARLWQHY